MKFNLINLQRAIENPKVLSSLRLGVKFKNCEDVLIMLKILNKKPRMFIDVGSGNGDYVKVIKHFYPKCKVHAFDPVGRYSTSKIALSNTDSYTNLFVEGLGSSLMKHPNTQEVQKIEVKRFDSLNINIEKPCILKIDAEGSELKILKGFGDLLKEINVIQIEYVFDKIYNKTYSLGDTINLLNSYGFYNFVQRVPRYLNNKLLMCDFIFWK